MNQAIKIKVAKVVEGIKKTLLIKLRGHFILIDWFIKLCVQAFQPLIVTYIKEKFVYKNNIEVKHKKIMELTKGQSELWSYGTKIYNLESLLWLRLF